MLHKVIFMIMLAGSLVLGTIVPVVAQQASENSESQQVVVRVDGVSCPFCAFGLEKRIGLIAGVQDVKIEFKAGKAIVSLEEGAAVSEAALRQAVKEAGFTAREITFPSGTIPVPAP